MTVEEFKNWCWAIIGGSVLLLIVLFLFYALVDHIRDNLLKELERRSNKNYGFLKERVLKLEEAAKENTLPRSERSK